MLCKCDNQSATFRRPANDQLDVPPERPQWVQGENKTWKGRWTVNVHDFVGMFTDEYVDVNGVLVVAGDRLAPIPDTPEEEQERGLTKTFETAQVLALFEDTKVSRTA